MPFHLLSRIPQIRNMRIKNKISVSVSFKITENWNNFRKWSFWGRAKQELITDVSKQISTCPISIIQRRIPIEDWNYINNKVAFERDIKAISNLG